MSDLTWTNSTRKLSDLIPWEKNPRQIKDAGAKRLVESMDQFGQIHAIAIGPGGEIYDGHQRSFVWAACERYGPDFEVDVRVASRPLTEPEREKLVIFLHSGATGSYDWDILSSWNTPTLKSWGLDEGQLRGWNDDAANLALMLEADKEEPPDDPGAQVDRAEELREKWGVKTGDMWRCGEHLIVCGDCTDPAVVARVMGGERAVLCHTDPPYGIDATGMTMGSGQSSKPKEARLSSNQDWDKRRVDISPLLKQTQWACIWGGNYFTDILPITNDWLCWHKKNDGLTFSEFELAWTNYGKQCRHIAHHWGSEKKQHITQKPLAVMEWAIGQCPDNGDVYDPFAGSGTTGVACERLGRKARLIEIEPKYCAVILQRFADMGLSPVVVEDAS